MLRKAPELVLIIGPCGAGKTTFARAYFPEHVQPQREAFIRAMTPDGLLHYYPELRAMSAQLEYQAVSLALSKGLAVCLTAGGATRQERSQWVALAQQFKVPTQVIRLVVTPEEALTRAQHDPHRPKSSKQHWEEVIAHWFRDFEPGDAAAEKLLSYQEVGWHDRS